MPIFRLQPVAANLNDPAWATSPVRSECWVNAADEAEARGMASARFQDARATVPGHTPAPSAWRDPRLVEALLVDHGPNAQEIPYGTVVSSPQM